MGATLKASGLSVIVGLNLSALGVAGISVDTLRQLYHPGTLVNLVMGADCPITMSGR
jgi:hypothetical protein